MRLNKFQSKSFWVLALVLFCLSAPAKEKMGPPAPALETAPAETNIQALERTLIDSNVVISNWFDSVAEGIDLFLVKNRVTDEPSKINAKLINSSYMIEGKGFTNTTSLSVSPRLYNLEKYWSLKFSTYDDLEETRGVRRGYLRQTPRDRNYGATVGLFRQLGDVRIAFQPRIELQDPLQVSHSLGFQSLVDMKSYRVNPKLEFYASSSRGTGSFHALNFNFTLNEYFTMTWINEGDYEDKSHKYSVTNGLSFGQSLSEETSLTYTVLAQSINQPNYHLDGYNLSVSWYQLIYNKIMDYQLIPNLDFREEDAFRGRAGLTFQLSVYF